MRLRLALSVIVALVGGVVSMPTAIAVVQGDPAPDGPSSEPAVSADGRWVAFISEASNLLGGDPIADPNGFADVFLVDTETATIRLVSSAAGVPADGPSVDVDISADGRFVAFETFATNLVPADANGAAGDIVLFDAWSGELTLVSRRGETGVQGDGDSFAPTISADGTKVAFGSRATNLIGSDTNDKVDIFVRDVVAGTTTRVSTNSTGRQANNASYDGAIAPTGTHVAWSSIASNLVTGDTNGARDVFLKNLSSGKTIRVSVTNAERQAKGNSGLEDVSADGRSVVFSSFASNLVSNDDNNKGDVFIRDRVDGTTVRASRRGAIEGNDDSFGAAISDDGGYVVFQTRATNLDVAADGNGAVSDLFEYRVQTKELVRASVDAADGWADGASYDAAISADGSVMAFASLATDLVEGDTDGVDDVFLHAWIDDERSERWVSWWSRALGVA
jgi:Tol biopolymer transport system component